MAIFREKGSVVTQEYRAFLLANNGYTIVRVLKNINNFKGDCKISTWIYKIGQNVCFRYMRENKKKRFDIEFLINKAINAKNDITYDQFEKEDLIEQVKEGCLTGLLQCLSLYQRSAFTLNVLFKLSIKETAFILEKTDGATKALIFRAKQNL